MTLPCKEPAGGWGRFRKLKPVEPEELKAAELMATTDLSPKQIAQKAGLTNGAAVKAAMRLPAVRGYLSAYLDEAGATLKASARAIADAHEAKEERVFVTKAGELVYADPTVDHQTRLKAAELNLKARGELREGASLNLFMDLSDEQLAQIYAGALDPASLIDVGPRIDNPAAQRP